MDVERRVRRLLEVTAASAHLDGPAGPASWVSGSRLNIYYMHYIPVDGHCLQ